MYNNAAAPAVREPYSVKWFDFDVSLGIAFPGAYGNTDFDNRGGNVDDATASRINRFTYYNAGLQLQFGQLGVTAMADFLSYAVGSRASDVSSLTLTLGRIHAVAAYGLLDNQVIIGAGARIVFVDLGQRITDGPLLQMLGAGPEVGVIVKPNGHPFRIGATGRAPVSATDIQTGRTTVDPTTGVAEAGGFIVPRSITQPWEVEAGLAWQFGPRPLNPAWADPDKDEKRLQKRIERDRVLRAAEHRRDLASMPGITDQDLAFREEQSVRFERDERATRAVEDIELYDAKERLRQQRKARYLNWPRDRVLLLASMTMTGPSSDAVALEGFFDQRREIVGRKVSFAPRFSAESEPVANLLRMRAGLYLEPSRFENGSTRQHFTFGGDLRLFSWDIFGIISEQTWRLTAFFDVAPRYQNFGFGIGAWQ